MTNHPLVKYQKQINDLAIKHQISYLGLFGSYARGDETKKSDIDLLVDFKKTPDLLELYDAQQDYTHLLKQDLDFVTVGGLNKYVKPYILSDLITLYGQRPSNIS
jgi:hypothetical protein